MSSLENFLCSYLNLRSTSKITLIALSACSEYKQSNVMLTVVFELMLNGEFETYIASFPEPESRVSKLNEGALRANDGKPAAFTLCLALI